VDNKQYKLCLEVLRRLDEAGVLKAIILIGSWCVPFYKDYFGRVKYDSSIRTRDMDFLVPIPVNMKLKVNLAEMLKDLGFIIGFQGQEGYIRLDHPDLAIEFLVSETGRGSSKAYPLPMLGINAQPLRYLNLLAQNIIKVEVDGMDIRLPHPAIFAFHKLIVSQLRRKEEKGLKDEQDALRILKALVEKNEQSIIKRYFDSIIPAWQKKIIEVLQAMNEEDILKILK